MPKKTAEQIKLMREKKQQCIQAEKERRASELEGYKNFFDSLNPRQQKFLLTVLDYQGRYNGNITVPAFLEIEYKINNGVYPYDDRQEFRILKFTKA